MPRRSASIAIAVALGLTTAVCVRRAWAYRPFDGTDAHVAGRGEFELELGPVHWYSQAGHHYLIAPATVLNLGIFRGAELVVDFQNYVGLDQAGAPGAPPGESRDRLLDTDVFLKGVLRRGSVQGESGPSVAAEVGPLLPNINGENGYGASCNVIVSQRWSDFTMHVNNRLELSRGDLHLDWFEGLILEGSRDALLRPVTELFVEREFVTRETTWSLLFGAIWQAREGLDLDIGLREARVGQGAVSEIRLGLTWTLTVWEAASKERAGHSALLGPPISSAAMRW
jgi:hypothetical protein